jgi:hypothetical protein
MDTHFNIYDKIESLEKEVMSLRIRIEQYEDIHQLDYNKKVKVNEDLEGFYTINDILRKYEISRQCFYNYRKFVPLKKSAKIGRFERFKKKDVHEFIQRIMLIKESQPQLFIYKGRKAS